MAELTLFIGNKNYSSWSMRPWLALRHIGVPFDEVVIPLDRPETHEHILRHSPSGRVPALHATHGELVIWESLAICEYLAEAFPDARLWPEQASERARARAVACEMHAGFAALREAMPMNLRRTPGPVARSPEVDADIARVVALWTECRARRPRGDFLFGGITIADAMFAPVVTRFRTYAVALDGPAAAYAEAVAAWPAYSEWVAAGIAEPLSMPRYEGDHAR